MITLSIVTATESHPYPLIRGGGLFLIFVGLGFLLGWIVPKIWIPSAIAGGAVGLTASGLSALLPSLGTPSIVQISALVFSFLVELGLIAFVLTRFKEADQRTQILAILLVVGLHFIIMGPAHGPLMALLGVVTVANALLGMRIIALPLRIFGVVDGLLKFGFGMVMLLLYPALTYT
ncbi:DUF6609 family protein [Planotetraspora kaengkrachanensis]|uniref:Uncharacterized protein n=1 Tax=Planotetraspora kaengkrachanensis TaxID=575193 RepID=A0A8J3LS07_9ACTN|nr:DUF6609 family protein [Planotetraspora kaengkrachanensis]GIG78113.1 hypothetical protein Pka01_12400 [Planotetraspora kaengkrachanensis]